ncbi:hypothetical protein G6F35_019174 [Rhizopus arrhizus]|nr:hypothetical protein G6F35_019174 [Rhizopus arrhizus]
MAVMPSSRLPSTMKATSEISRKPTCPPGTPALAAARAWEKPDWVSAQAMALAAPTMKRMAPESEAVRASMGRAPRQLRPPR